VKNIEVITDSGYLDTIVSIAEQYEAKDCWHYSPSDDDRYVIRILAANDSVQSILDSIQKTIASSEHSRVLIMPVEASLSKNELVEKVSNNDSISREALYQSIKSNAHLGYNYLLLVVLSTIVASVGMLESSIAVVIGAMVIAPLLGPNIALTFATVLGDSKLMLRALTTLFVGVVVALVISYVLSWIYPTEEYNQELLSRTHVNYSAVVMALASGAAAALSMTTGLSSVLVGVMVAVAILPPTCVLGLMLGYQQLQYAFDAFMLLAINIVCINLSGIIVFLAKGIRPRTSGDIRKAKKVAIFYILIWCLLLVILLIKLIK